MNRIRQRKIYLAGPIWGNSDDVVNAWRDQAAAALQPRYRVSNPVTRFDARGRTLSLAECTTLVEGDLLDIHTSDLILAYFPVVAGAMVHSPGTCMEIREAYLRQKEIWIVIPGIETAQWSPWLRYHASFTAVSLEYALARLTERAGD